MGENKTFIPKSIICFLFSLISSVIASSPVPQPWPLQFHSILVMNSSKGVLQIDDLWYDFPNGRNFNIIQNQLGQKLYSLEWNNGTSFYYTLDSDKVCSSKHDPVGILRPNWLEGANYLGQQYKDGFLCNVWEKAEIVWYYEDVITKTPVYWYFHTGTIAHFMTFEVGRVLEDPNWQAPVYCFEESNEQNKPALELIPATWNLMRQLQSIPASRKVYL